MYGLCNTEHDSRAGVGSPKNTSNNSAMVVTFVWMKISSCAGFFLFECDSLVSRVNIVNYWVQI